LTVRLLTFFFQAEDGIRDFHVTGVQTCALPISPSWVMNPKPFASLNHFTVPVAMFLLFSFNRNGWEESATLPPEMRHIPEEHRERKRTVPPSQSALVDCAQPHDCPSFWLRR